MTVYVAICCDRHIDECVRVFSTPDKAVAFCKQFMAENARFPDAIREHRPGDWLYDATYSVEGDSVRVELTEVDDAS
jgi:hypothetical protein